MKLYILARKDAPIGKVMAHVGHVCCQMLIEHDGWGILHEWIKEDQTKIILEVKNEIELLEWRNSIKATSETIIDIHTKQYYCLAIGPLTDEEAKELGLKELRLFK